MIHLWTYCGKRRYTAVTSTASSVIGIDMRYAPTTMSTNDSTLSQAKAHAETAERAHKSTRRNAASAKDRVRRARLTLKKAKKALKKAGKIARDARKAAKAARKAFSKASKAVEARKQNGKKKKNRKKTAAVAKPVTRKPARAKGPGHFTRPQEPEQPETFDLSENDLK